MTTRATPSATHTKAFYINGTHWDREWYEPFQEFRMWLVQMLDDALDAVQQDERLGVFHLDGQVVMIEDYLEIRPEKRDELFAHLKSGQFLAGPWYVQPDEWLVSGEAIIRNLALGRRLLNDWGIRPMAVGYLPDMFGHISAMPSIFAGFGIEYGVVWRGANDAEVGCPFQWIGPDGARLLMHKLPDHGGYGWFGIRLRDAWKAADYDDKVLLDLVRNALATEQARVDAPVIYLSDASDHRMLVREAPKILDLLRGEFPDIEFIHASIEDFFRELAACCPDVPAQQGELRRPAQDLHALYHALIPHCLSSRYPLKQRNDQCQSLLSLWAEPMAAYAAMSGHPLPPGYLTTAWKWLLKNQPHDSICGCSIDATHADMPYRYQQAEGIGDGLRRQAMARLGTVQPEVRKGASYLSLWNPLPWERSEVVELTIPFASDFEPKRLRSGHSGPLVNQFEVVDADGVVIPCQIRGIDLQQNLTTFDETGKRQMSNQNVDIYHVSLPVCLPPAGSTCLHIRPVEAYMPRTGETLRCGPQAIANEHLRLEVDDRGSVRLQHKASGACYDDLFLYEDCGDSGDGWVFVRPARDRRIVSHGHRVICSIENEGPHQTTLRIDRHLTVPVGVRGSDKEARSEETTTLTITDRLTLKAGDPCLHVATQVDNTACDHRLRVLFPTGIAAEHYSADHPFDIVSRPVHTDPETLKGKEPDPPERPHHSFVALTAEDRGFALLCPEGLHEHEIGTDPSRTIALTLFRSISDTPRTNGEPGSQVQGRLSFRYALQPFAGVLQPGSLLRRIAALQAGVQAFISREAAGTISYLQVDGPESVVVSAVKPGPAKDVTVVRLWNSSGEPVDASLRLPGTRLRAHSCDFDEAPGDELPVQNGVIQVHLPARAIVSLSIESEATESHHE